ncbi:hypothetical protein EJ08DRAFT_658363 [Tothia fuscella]|uniref:Uncharacterized protein n=1 Tax=Tothia fuscella TaxID=1048955 RepID=A0A9P4U1N0_9PEZI|nr:hypothetical protein EJ08DRAFT_658363 [Tothia fuscella]
MFEHRRNSKRSRDSSDQDHGRPQRRSWEQFAALPPRRFSEEARIVRNNDLNLDNLPRLPSRRLRRERWRRRQQSRREQEQRRREQEQSHAGPSCGDSLPFTEGYYYVPEGSAEEQETLGFGSLEPLSSSPSSASSWSTPSEGRTLVDSGVPCAASSVHIPPSPRRSPQKSPRKSPGKSTRTSPRRPSPPQQAQCTSPSHRPARVKQSTRPPRQSRFYLQETRGPRTHYPQRYATFYNAFPYMTRARFSTLERRLNLLSWATTALQDQYRQYQQARRRGELDNLNDADAQDIYADIRLQFLHWVTEFRRLSAEIITEEAGHMQRANDNLALMGREPREDIRDAGNSIRDRIIDIGNRIDDVFPAGINLLLIPFDERRMLEEQDFIRATRFIERAIADLMEGFEVDAGQSFDDDFLQYVEHGDPLDEGREEEEWDFDEE